jgi:GT2 family glycosyltransferase
VLSQTNLGHGRGFNVACAHADPRAALYVKLDSDLCPLTKGWESRMLALAQAEPRAGVLGIVQVNHLLMRTAPSVVVAGEAVIPWSTWACGSCMGIPRATFDRLGYFAPPPGITYTWDDVDYWMRALRAGFAGYYLRDVVAAHQTALDASRYRSAAGARNRVQVRALLRKHARDYDTGASSLSCFPQECREVSERWPGERLAVWPAKAGES